MLAANLAGWLYSVLLSTATVKYQPGVLGTSVFKSGSMLRDVGLAATTTCQGSTIFILTLEELRQQCCEVGSLWLW